MQIQIYDFINNPLTIENTLDHFNFLNYNKDVKLILPIKD